MTRRMHVSEPSRRSDERGVSLHGLSRTSGVSMKLTEIAPSGLEMDPRKVTHYLFDLAHERGGPKGRFFLLFGFRVDDPETLMRALIQHGSEYEIASIDDRGVATVYTIEGEIASPDGRDPRIRT